MDIQTLKMFFMWCTLVNVGLMILSFLLWIAAADFIYKLHSRWFPMPRETFNVIFYAFLGVYKLAVYVFNIVPWIALAIVE